MNSHKTDELFAAALELSPDKRAAFLAAECRDDAALRKKLERLLAADAAAEDGFFLHDPAFALEAEDLLEVLNDSRVGTTIGRYKITALIGAGGMGAVYRAERADGQFEKAVALKIVKRGMDTDEILRRFLRERQILASLEHPNIARLLDAGMTADGTPFFVMELVEGTPIDEFCRDRNLSAREKLNLFRTICMAVAHAHRNLIVHRDLKPSNILITRDGVPKLLDFGIAKLLTETNAEQTQTNFRVLTLAYAAPEQKIGGAVTTATDVYSLGLILSELLGVAPGAFAGKSKKVKTLESDNPPTEVKRRMNFLPADLQTILQTALREEPFRRYGSAEKFADDIKSYLNNLPISARRDSYFYRAGKFIERNRVTVVFAALILVAALTGTAATWRQSQVAKIERARAENRFNDVRELARSVIFKYHDEIAKLQGATRVREMLVADALRYLDRLASDAGVADDAELRIELAEAYIRMGDVQGQPYYANIGDTPGAIESYRKAVKLLEIFESGENAAALKLLAQSYERLGDILNRNSSPAEERRGVIRRSIELREKIARQTPGAEAQLNLALGYLALGQASPIGVNENQSAAVYEKGAVIVEALLRDDPSNQELLLAKVKFDGRIAFAFSQLGLQALKFWESEKSQRFYQSSIPYFERAVADAERLYAIDPQHKIYRRAVFVNQANLGEVLAATNRPDEAVKILNSCLKYSEAVLAADAANREVKFELAENLLDLARAYVFKGDKRSAEKFFVRGMNLLDEIIAADPQNTEFVEFQISSLSYNYGDAQIIAGDYDAALKTYRRAWR